MGARDLFGVRLLPWAWGLGIMGLEGGSLSFFSTHPHPPFSGWGRRFPTPTTTPGTARHNQHWKTTPLLPHHGAARQLRSAVSGSTYEGMTHGPQQAGWWLWGSRLQRSALTESRRQGEAIGESV